MRPYQHVHAALGAVRAGCFADAAGEYALASAGYERKGLMATARNYAELSAFCAGRATVDQLMASRVVVVFPRPAPAVVVPFPGRARA